jgi:hypothetical protein
VFNEAGSPGISLLDLFPPRESITTHLFIRETLNSAVT